jgi:hypothetical protein
MALQHKTFDVQGVQFHPESVLTPDGRKDNANWLLNLESSRSALAPSRLKKNHEEDICNIYLSTKPWNARRQRNSAGMSRGQYNEARCRHLLPCSLCEALLSKNCRVSAMHCLSFCVKIDLNGNEVMDIVGTGGDGKNTFNISTLSCFIVAGAGQKVAKHGNYGASSISGSSNVMEQLGYTFKNDNTSC